MKNPKNIIMWVLTIFMALVATGERITTDPAGMIGLCGQYGLEGIADIQTDNPGYVELCGAMLAVYGGGADAQH